MSNTPKHKMTPEQRRKISEQAKLRWANPEFRQKVGSAMSTGAKARWADKEKRADLLAARQDPEIVQRAAKRSAQTRLEKSAQKYGVDQQLWLSLSRKDRMKIVADWKKANPTAGLPIRNNNRSRELAARFGVELTTYLHMTDIDKIRLRNRWLKANGYRTVADWKKDNT